MALPPRDEPGGILDGSLMYGEKVERAIAPPRALYERLIKAMQRD